jgi:transcription-repair coupling factor (superfamily II helicase)
MQDAEEAGYFYHDLCQVMGDKQVLFFPSSYKRAIKYGQKDPASEILRTEVLSQATHHNLLYIVTYPEALAEMVVTRKQLDARRLTLEQDQSMSVDVICKTLREFGFREVDYV